MSNSKTTRTEVEAFLRRFVAKVKVFGLIFRDDRGKNRNTLLELEITPKCREDIILRLAPDDYINGPIADTLHHIGEMWVFGKDVKGKDVYIKISMGLDSGSAICISFHIAENKLNYKFK